jgi:spermidine synthase
MGTLVKSLSDTDSAYRMFLGGGYIISTAIMLPATFCAGMTLPLFTTVLLRSSYGERAIGNIYAANTVGAIVGVMFAVHIGFELLGLKGLVVTGALLDIGLGLFILWRLVKPVPMGWLIPLATVSVSVVLGALLIVQFDPLKLSSAVYRNGSPTGDTKKHKIVFLEDGKTATISVSTNNFDTASIATNGKPDAALSLDPTKRTTDEATMTLAGVIPLLLKPDAETVANIGFGSGQTTHTLLASDKVKRIDTIEIERQMIEGAKVFRERVSRAYDDERSHIYIDDAKTFFARNQRQYDIIVSEPSNPWVSGTATLFSKEFYQHVKHYLKDDSLFVQWIQLYEINIDLVMTVLTALNDEFSDYHMYYAGPNDLLILAKKKGEVPFIDQARLDAADKKIHQSINRLRIASLDDFRARWVGDKKLYSPLLRLGKYEANSDYYPILEQKSPKLRFQKQVANEISNIRTSIFPVIDALRPAVLLGIYYSISPTEKEENQHSANITAAMNSPLFRDGNQPISVAQMPALSTANALDKAKTECATQSQARYWVYLMSDLVIELFPNIDIGRRVNIVKRFAPDCDGPWRAELNMWHHFFKAFSVQHWPGTVEAATVVMSKTKLKMRDRETHVLFGAALMGMSLTGNHQRAVDSWQSTGHKIFASGNPPLEIKLLLANSRMQLENGQSDNP